MYAEIAINAPLHQTFHYAVPPALQAVIRPGHLVEIPFGTARQHGLVVDLLTETAIPDPKAIVGLIHPQPLLTFDQLDLGLWMAARYLAPLGYCLWLMLPPGITNGRDIRLTLLDPNADRDDPVERKLLALLRKREGVITGHQIELAKSMQGIPWESTVNRMVKDGLLGRERILRPPRTRPKLVQTAALAIHPNMIPSIIRTLGRESRRADALLLLAALPDDPPPTVDGLLRACDLSSRGPVEALEEADLVRVNREARPHTVSLAIPRESLNDHLIPLRKAEKHLHILHVLARERGAMEVSWLYAQTDCKLGDLQHLEELGYVVLGELPRWRDSLAERAFVLTDAPPLTAEQAAVWEAIHPLLTSPEYRGGTRGQRVVLPAKADSLRASESVRDEARDPLLTSPEFGGGTRGQRDVPPARVDSRRASESVRDGAIPAVPPSPNSGRAGEGSRINRSYKGNYREWRTPAHIWKHIHPYAAQMRRQQTPAEQKLWQQLRKHQIGVKFRRQHIIGPYIVDFYCAEARLIIEVDGPTHDDTTLEDAARQSFLESRGFTVIRFTNQAIYQALDYVVQLIQDQVTGSGVRDPLLTSPEFGGGTRGQRDVAPARVDSQRASESVRDEARDPLLTSPEFGGGTRGQRDVSLAKVDSQRPSESVPDGAIPAVPPSPNSGRAGEGSSVFLLQGVTGSGKTEIYLRAIEAVVAQGRQAILLVPEIALTAQTIRRVGARLTGRLAVVHSQLSEGERYDTWRRAREGLIDVVIGARSALFTPLPHLGLIILDEEHDRSYKNSESPFYHAREVAEERLKDTEGTLILGSATPALETIYRAEQGQITHLRLPSRIIGHRQHIYQQAAAIGREAEYNRSALPDALMMELPPVQVVDMREELKAGNTSIFSGALQSALAEVLKQKQQAILFLNRRGAATYVFCRDCGYVAACPNCDSPLTWHRQGEALRCHRCGHTAPEPKRCPQCASGRIKFFGAGTQQVEAAMNALFPQARTLRWDADTATTAEMHEYFLQRFIDHKADVLIGTQMIAKGLDLPLVTLVGVVSADMALNLPDFRAGEQTFQTLTQVAGRAGRGLLGGRVILQTYQPEHYAIQFAARHDVDGFYAHEMAFRQQLGYPPFRRLVRIVIRGEQESRAAAEAEAAADLLRARLRQLGLSATEIIGPAPCFFRRVNSIYRWHLLLRGPDPSAVLRGFEPPRGWSVEVDPLDVL
jgi:primosomal protein N'/very-short-patch-repair endonuclease